MPEAEAIHVLNEAIADLSLDIAVEAGGASLLTVRSTASADAEVLIRGAVALAVVDFLAGPHVTKLRSCQAPRCVRYFVQRHGRQEWCKESCGNRARAARHRARSR